MEKRYGIAIRITDQRDSFYTAGERMQQLIEFIEEKNYVYFASDLSIGTKKMKELSFVVFFDSLNNQYYMGVIAKVGHKKFPYRPTDIAEYGYEKDEPHRTWILLRLLVPMPEDILMEIYVKDEFILSSDGSKKYKTLSEKIKEPRFPRVYVFLNSKLINPAVWG